MILTDENLEGLSRDFETVHPQVILEWAVGQFWPKIAVSSSFQTQGVPLLHMIAQTVPQLPVIFLDTGYHFPETLAFRDQLVQLWNLDLRIVRAISPHNEPLCRTGDDLHRRDPDRCCYINKVEPMKRAMAGLNGWISGIRRDQSTARAHIQVLERLATGTIRIHPLAAWNRQDIFQYIDDHHLPEHPLLAQGYLSVGCAPCTRPVLVGEDERAGRWNGQAKIECGLHTLLREPALNDKKAPDSQKEVSST